MLRGVGYPRRNNAYRRREEVDFKDRNQTMQPRQPIHDYSTPGSLHDAFTYHLQNSRTNVHPPYGNSSVGMSRSPPVFAVTEALNTAPGPASPMSREVFPQYNHGQDSIHNPSLGPHFPHDTSKMVDSIINSGPIVCVMEYKSAQDGGQQCSNLEGGRFNATACDETNPRADTIIDPSSTYEQHPPRCQRSLSDMTWLDHTNTMTPSLLRAPVLEGFENVVQIPRRSSLEPWSHIAARQGQQGPTSGHHHIPPVHHIRPTYKRSASSNEYSVPNTMDTITPETLTNFPHQEVMDDGSSIWRSNQSWKPSLSPTSRSRFDETIRCFCRLITRM